MAPTCHAYLPHTSHTPPSSPSPPHQTSPHLATLHLAPGLQDLTVLSASSQLLLPATSALTALTRACLLLRDLAHNAHKLQHLPPQLRKLEVTVGWAAAAAASSSGGSRPALPLGHLTGLLELRGSGYFALQVRGGLFPPCTLLNPDSPHKLHQGMLRFLRTSAARPCGLVCCGALPYNVHHCVPAVAALY